MPTRDLFLFSLLIVALIATNIVKAQTCTASTIVSNFTYSYEVWSVQCQVGYVADSRLLQCRPLGVVFDENYGKPCNSTSDCLPSFVCSDPSKICVPSNTRKLGEPCLATESCITGGCLNGICTPITTSYEKKVGERCNYIDYTTNKYNSCASPYYCNYLSYPNYKCYEWVYNGAGGFCGINDTSSQSFSCNSGAICNTNTKKCVTAYYNATQGDSCQVYTEDSYVTCKSQFSCYSGKCYGTQNVGLGEQCNYRNSTSFNQVYCSSEFLCLGSKCVRTINAPLGGYCGQNDTDVYSCAYGTATCYNNLCIPVVKSNVGGKCDITNSEGSYSCNDPLYCFNNTCMENGNLGQSCQHKTDSCITGLVCRAVLGGNNPKTCENPGKKYDNCSLTSECQYGLSCVNSQCTNLNGYPVGAKCLLHSECDSGLCLNNICSLNYNETTCSSDNSCYNYGSKCSCGGGKATSNTQGTCASLKRCKAFYTILSTCLSNNGRDVGPTIIFDKYSSIHKACAKEFSQYYSCLRTGLTNAGNVDALPISGLDINADFDIDPAPAKIYKCGSYYSTSSNVCSYSGDCIADGVCKCYTGYYGSLCETNIPITPEPSNKPVPQKSNPITPEPSKPVPQKSNPITPQKSNPIVPNKSIGANRNDTTAGTNNLKENSLLITLSIVFVLAILF